MPDANGDQRHGTYRCPVCGHSDLAALDQGELVCVLECSYCETLLEVWSRGADSMRFASRVAEEHARR